MHAAIECDSLALQSRLLSCGMGIALAAAGEWRQLCEEGSVHLLHIRRRRMPAATSSAAAQSL